LQAKIIMGASDWMIVLVYNEVVTSIVEVSLIEV